jgi:hypothetical protein
MREAHAVTAIGAAGARDIFPVAEPAEPAGLDMGVAMLALRRLHFYRDLLRIGFEGTIWPDRSSRTLRNERLALGIDLPELDLVALWATRCGDGRISIPFIEYLLAQARATAKHFLPVDRKRTIATQVAQVDAALTALAALVPEALPADGLPRLGEVFITETEAVSLCGAGGVIDRLVARCEERLLALV